MAIKHTIKLYARLLQKGTYTESDIPEDIRSEVLELAKTLPLREDMKDCKPVSDTEENKVSEEVNEVTKEENKISADVKDKVVEKNKVDK